MGCELLTNSYYNCYIIRGNIPYDAWMYIVPGIKKARELGLLDSWSSYNRRFG